MKRSIILILSLLLISISSYSKELKFYVIDIKQEINAASARILTIGLEKANKASADFIIVRLNTYGGAVDAADSMRNALLNSKIPTIAFINNQAVSAGALISIACDSIYMSRGSTFGAATVVNQKGEVLPDKYQSFMRAMMRSTAESKGRDPRIAEAMVDQSIYIKGITDSSKVLSFTREEAINAAYCEGEAESPEEIAQMISNGSDYSIQKLKLTWLDKIISIFLLPLVQGVLLMLVIGGLYFEMQSPGIGFPLAVSITALALYLLPLYLEGLAENWEIALFVAGILLILAEIFIIPGFGVAGISGIVLSIGALILVMVDNRLFYVEGGVNLLILIKPAAIVLTSAFVSLMLSFYLASKLLTTSGISHKLALKKTLNVVDGYSSNQQDLNSLIGKRATAATSMRPSGKIDIAGIWYDATLEIGMAKKGDSVVITRVEGSRLYCEYLAQ